MPELDMEELYIVFETVFGQRLELTGEDQEIALSMADINKCLFKIKTTRAYAPGDIAALKRVSGDDEEDENMMSL